MQRLQDILSPFWEKVEKAQRKWAESQLEKIEELRTASSEKRMAYLLSLPISLPYGWATNEAANELFDTVMKLVSEELKIAEATDAIFKREI